MPGLCAVVSSRPGGRVGALAGAMVAKMTHYAWHKPAQWTGPSAALGSVALVQLASQALFTDSAVGSTVVLDGEIYDADRERTRLVRAGAPFAGRSSAELLLRGYHAEGRAFLERLHGAFTALFWDANTGTLTVVTDRFGMRPAYVARPAGLFVVASEIKAVLCAPGVDTSWSEGGVAEFFAFGHFYGADTLLAGVRALPAAVCGVYRLHDGSYREERYWTHRPGKKLRDDEAVAALESALVAAVGRRATSGERLGLSLSGGLDARTILALMPAGLDLRTVSLGIEGSLDHRSSTKLAVLVGVPHTNYVLDTSFLSSFEQHLREMVALTDGHYLDQGIVMPTMPLYRELGIDFLHRGHGGELLHMKKAYAFSLDADALAASEAGLEDWLFLHVTDYMLSGVPDDLFTIDVRGRAREALRAALAATEAGERPVDRVWQLFVNQRLHRETALSMHAFNCFAGVRMPFIDNDVVVALASMPARMKLDETLQAAVLGHRRPEFLAVANANTGARVGAGRLVREAAYFRMRIAAKLGIKGYQPYERLGSWLRRELRELVRRGLLNEAFLGIGLFRPEAVRGVVDDHLSGRANHTFLLMSLLIFGMGSELRSGGESTS